MKHHSPPREEMIESRTVSPPSLDPAQANQGVKWEEKGLQRPSCGRRPALWCHHVDQTIINRFALA